MIGSIAHGGTVAVAVVARRGPLRGLGVDIEPAHAVTPDLAGTILDPKEHGLDPTEVFVIKEAVYKAQFPLSQRLFGFDAVRVTALGGGAFTARLMADAPPFTAGDVIPGRIIRAGGHVLAVAVLR